MDTSNMKGLKSNLEKITYVQVECASFFEVHPEAEAYFVKVLHDVFKTNDFISVNITLEHHKETETKWCRSVSIKASFTNKDNTKSGYSFGSTYRSSFLIM